MHKMGYFSNKAPVIIYAGRDGTGNAQRVSLPEATQRGASTSLVVPANTLRKTPRQLFEEKSGMTRYYFTPVTPSASVQWVSSSMISLIVSSCNFAARKSASMLSSAVIVSISLSSNSTGSGNLGCGDFNVVKVYSFHQVLVRYAVDPTPAV